MEQAQPFVERDATLDSQLFVQLLKIVRDVQNALKLTDKQSGQNLFCDSGSEGDCSSGEDENASQQQQSESVQDLHEELTRLELSEGATTLESLIIIVEHYMKSGDEEGFMKNIRRPDKWLLTTPRPEISNLQAMAENLQKQKLHFRAVVMHKALCTLYKYEYVHCLSEEDRPGSVSPNDAVSGIESSLRKVFEIFNDIFNNSEYEKYLTNFVAIMYDMLTNLREIHHTNRKFKANLEAWGLLYIAVVHGRLDQVYEMQDFTQSIVTASEKRFKKKAQNYIVYGVALLVLSLSYRLDGDLDEVIKCSERAVVAFQEALGMSWDDKVKLVAEVQKYVDTLTD